MRINQVVEKMAALIIASFGLVAALAWNGAIQTAFNKYYGVSEGLTAKFVNYKNGYYHRSFSYYLDWESCS